jgi:hypothetical protein
LVSFRRKYFIFGDANQTDICFEKAYLAIIIGSGPEQALAI